MTEQPPSYGLWGLALVNSAVFILFAFSFSKPRTEREWRTFSSFSALLVALFVEMYGFPLTIYLLSGWLQSRVPGGDLLSHEGGHLWYSLLGLKGDPHFHPIHLLSQDARRLALATAIVTAILWILCSAAVSLAPGPGTLRVRLIHSSSRPATIRTGPVRSIQLLSATPPTLSSHMLLLPTHPPTQNLVTPPTREIPLLSTQPTRI